MILAKKCVVLIVAIGIASCVSWNKSSNAWSSEMNTESVYIVQTESTNPGAYVEIYYPVKNDIEAVLQYMDNRMLLRFGSGADLTDEQKKDPAARTTQDILKALRERKNSFSANEPHERRFAGLCYHWSLLTASILRSKGVPCRLRCGFAPYLSGGKKGIDDTVVEIWDKKSKSCYLVDPEFTNFSPKFQRETFGIEQGLNSLNIPYSQFHTAAEAWFKLRRQKVSNTYYGLFWEEPSYGFVRTALIRDWLSVLGYERNVSCSPRIKGLASDEDEKAYLDTIGELMLEPDKNFEELKKHLEDIDFEGPNAIGKPEDRKNVDLRPLG